jgi:AAA family ATP:ADP antiporter
MTSFIQRFVNVKRGEVAPLLMAGFYFFCVLTAIGLLRPTRDAIGMERGIDNIRWLFIGTAVVTLAINPVFGFLVSRFRRIRFISITYAFFALSLVGFFALIALAPAAVGIVSGRVFYIWSSVFNLFGTMVFWALMADCFTLEQGKRLFGAIAVGGTLGAVAGPALAAALAEPLGTPALLLVAAAFLIVAVGAAWSVAWLRPAGPPATGTPGAAPAANNNTAIIGGTAWEGLRAVVQSRYLLGISTYVLLMTVVATFIYFTRLRMVDALGGETDANTTVLAQIDLITQTATLLLQLLLTGHIMRWLGVSVALVLLPITAALGFVGLAIAGSFAALVVFDAAFRAIQRGVTRPARETLFTVVSRMDKYKSKAVTDTFVYRGGDVVGAWTEGLLGRAGMALVGLTSVVVPLAAVWLILGLWLARSQKAMASPEPSASERGDTLAESLPSPAS